MRERFAPTLGATVEERINEALAHKARLKYTDIQQYVQGWLRRDAERVGTTGRSNSVSRRMAEMEKVAVSHSGARKAVSI